MVARCLLLVTCSGCVLGGGGAIGYGTKRGPYVGGSVSAGVTAGQLTFELGGTGRGALVQGKLEADVSEARIKWTEIKEDRLYPGGRLGIGYAVGDEEALALNAGGSLAFDLDHEYCVDSLISLGLEYRWIGGESQIVFTPRYEKVWGLCFE